MQKVLLNNKFLTPCEIFTHHFINKLKESNEPEKLLEMTRQDLISIFNNKDQKTGEPIVSKKNIFGKNYEFSYERFFLDEKNIKGAITPEIFSYIQEISYKLKNSNLNDIPVQYPKALLKHQDLLLKTKTGDTMFDPFFRTGDMFIVRLLIIKNDLKAISTKEKFLKRILKNYHGNETDREAVEVGIERLSFISLDKYNENFTEEEKDRLRKHITDLDFEIEDFEKILKMRKKKKPFDFVMTIVPDFDIYNLLYHKKIINGINNITMSDVTPIITFPRSLLRYEGFKKILCKMGRKIEFIDLNNGVYNSLYIDSATVIYGLSGDVNGSIWMKYQNTNPYDKVCFEGLNKVHVFENKIDFIKTELNFNDF